MNNGLATMLFGRQISYGKNTFVRLVFGPAIAICTYRQCHTPTVNESIFNDTSEQPTIDNRMNA